MLSPGAIAEMGKDFDEIEQELRAQAAEQLRVSGAAWEFERRQGVIADELIAVGTATGKTHPGETVMIMVGSSPHATPPRDRLGRDQPCSPLATRRCLSSSCPSGAPGCHGSAGPGAGPFGESVTHDSNPK
jgi:hypothetical protein